MNFSDYAAAAGIAGGAVVVIVGVLISGWFKIQKTTIELLREQNGELRVSHADLLEKNIDNQKQLASMQGQIDVLQRIPLARIDAALQELARINEKQFVTLANMLAGQQKSAQQLTIDTKAAADDRAGVAAEVATHNQ